MRATIHHLAGHGIAGRLERPMDVNQAIAHSIELPRVDSRATFDVPFAERCEHFIRDHHRTLLNLLSSKLHSAADAKDIAQEAYVRLLQLDCPSTIRHLRGWVFRTALNLATDRLRERTRRARDEHLVRLHTEREAVPSAERVWIERQGWEQLRYQVERLPPKCREAFMLVELQAQTIAQVAARMGVKPNTVCQLIRRAYAHLAATLSSKNTDISAYSV
jgi:RNA polymerase sigma factor (sigma-70 family)